MFCGYYYFTIDLYELLFLFPSVALNSIIHRTTKKASEKFSLAFNFYLFTLKTVVCLPYELKFRQPPRCRDFLIGT